MCRVRSCVPVMVSFLVVVFGVAGFPGCGQQKPDVAAPAKRAAGQPSTPDDVTSQPIAEKDCREYANQVVRAVASGDRAAFNALIDWDALFAVSTANLGAAPKVISGWIQEMKQTLATDSSFGGALIQNTKAGGQFDFLRTRIGHGRQVIVFRMIGPASQGVNYIEFVAKRGADHKIRAMNLYPYASGEFMTETLRRALLPAAASRSRSFLEKLVSNEQDFVLDLPKFQPIAQAIQQGKKNDALRMLDRLRPETKKTKMVLLMRIQAAREADEKLYLAALEEFRSLFPSDPC
jgi:hypothetical protein